MYCDVVVTFFFCTTAFRKESEKERQSRNTTCGHIQPVFSKTNRDMTTALCTHDMQSHLQDATSIWTASQV